MQEMTVGIAGYGAIGRAVAARLLAGVPGVRLAALGVRAPEAIEAPGPGVAMMRAAALAEHVGSWSSARRRPRSSRSWSRR